MKEEIIKINNLNKQFTFSVKNENRSFLSNLFSPEKKSVIAVNNINFNVYAGERLAFIGPNGAGKSTTIKMLTGILYPSSGVISVLGLNPQEQRKSLAYKIGTVFGQRSQLFPNLPLTDSMYFFGQMYDLNKNNIDHRIEELCNIFDLNSFKSSPVRKLSLGQRMKAEIACALIHKPEIIFLDEPTIGLDVVAKNSLRELLLKLNKEENTTIFLTSHDVGDIEALCERTIIVNHGQIVKDLPTSELTKTFIYEKYIDLTLNKNSEQIELPKGLTYKSYNKDKISITIDLKEIELKTALKVLLEVFDVRDINISDIDLETVIREMYEKSE